MATGIIKTKTDKGFGFISVQGSDDVFFHHSACNGQFDNLDIGTTVQFDIEKGEKGLKAANVVAAGANTTAAPSKNDDMPSEATVDETMAA
jgi:CspA family cold shock protein